MFYHFVGLALKGLTDQLQISVLSKIDVMLLNSAYYDERVGYSWFSVDFNSYWDLLISKRRFK